MKPLLITTATQPPKGVHVLKMESFEKRTLLSKAAVFFWAGVGVRKMVVADATGQVLLENDDLQRLGEMGVQVEQLSYNQDNKAVIAKGKGYGEGALVDFALSRSMILNSETHFYKCTGKVYCRNFGQINLLIQSKEVNAIFWQDPFSNSIDTRFFYASRDFVRQSLIPAYATIDDRRGVCSENVVFELARSELIRGTTVRPLLSGFSGSLDEPYFDQGLGFLDANYPCWAN